MAAEPVVIAHREGYGSDRWVVLECLPGRLAARVLGRFSEEGVALGVVAAITDERGGEAYRAAVLDAESPF